MKISDYKNLSVKNRKYHNEKVNGYDSRKEYNRAIALEILEQNGIILNLRKQVSYILLPAQYVLGYEGKQICGRREMRYIADFVYEMAGQTIVEDVKGFKTKEYSRKKILMKKIYGIEIKET